MARQPARQGLHQDVLVNGQGTNGTPETQGILRDLRPICPISPMPRTIPTIAITLGDPAGIGPEVIAKTLRDPRLPKGFRYEVLGRRGKIRPGKSTRASAHIALAALEEAVQGCREKRFAAMVTG